MRSLPGCSIKTRFKHITIASLRPHAERYKGLRSTSQQERTTSPRQQAPAYRQGSQPVQKRPSSPAPAHIAESPFVVAQRAQIDNTFGSAIQPKARNQTGLPDDLKSGVESLSGMSMDSVRVHYNSAQPAQLNAHAYAQGTNIHIAPGQEKHLPHEAWHVVQQAQGRVRPTMQMKSGVPINDDKGLEHEATVMGSKAAAVTPARAEVESDPVQLADSATGNAAIVAAPLQAMSVLSTSAAPAVQLAPSNNNDPTGQADGVYWNRQEGSATQPAAMGRVTAIMKSPPNGGVPSVSPPGWAWLQNAVGKLKGSWVRFHIINQLLGGPGNQTWNLVPTTVAVNNAYSRGLEEDAKESAIDNDTWTYVDTILTYNPAWPAAIPTVISATWGSWNAGTNQWVQQGAVGPLANIDITTLGNGGPGYLRGVNITQAQLVKHPRLVPANQLRAFQTWLQNYTQADDDDSDFNDAGEEAFGGDVGPFTVDWMDQMWLDENPTVPGQYVVVVKAL